MAVTENLYTGDGSTVLYSFTFPYLEESDIFVSVDGTDTTAYTLPNPTTISFNTAPANGASIRIYRSTNIDALDAEFYPGSSIRAQDLNGNFDQTLYVVQEVRNGAVLADGSTTFVGDLDMGGNEIINLGTPTSDGAAVNKQYVDSRLGDVDVPGHTRWRYNAAGGETSLSGIGSDGSTLQYSATREQVFLNGALLQRGVDYSADDGATVNLISGALVAGDVVDVQCVNNLSTAPGQAADVSFLQSGTGATLRTVESKLRDVVSVKDFGAVGDGVTDDTAAIQAAVANIQARTNGGCLYFPSGTYIMSSGNISLDRSSDSTLGRVSIRGEDMYSTRIIYSGPQNACIDIIGNATIGENSSYSTISDLWLEGPSLAANSVGISLNIAPFVKFERLYITGFFYGTYGTDVDQFYAQSVIWRFNRVGSFFRKNPVPVAASTSTNNHVYISCGWFVNYNYGAFWGFGTEIALIGGAVAQNGSVPEVAGSGFGLKFDNCGYGGGRGANIQGTYIEGNVGIADVILSADNVEATPYLNSIHTIAANFKRLADSFNKKAVNHILCNFGDPTTVGLQQLVLLGSSFRTYPDYTPSAATKAIAFGVTPASIFNFTDVGSYFQEPIEKPIFCKNHNPKDVSVYRSGGLAVPDSTNTQILLNTAITTLLDGSATPQPVPIIWTPTFSGGGIVIDEEGTFVVDVYLEFTTAFTATKIIRAYRNNTLIRTKVASDDVSTAEVVFSHRFLKGDVLTFFIEQQSGVSRTLNGTSTSSLPRINISKVY
jgi:hypothetical protein